MLRPRREAQHVSTGDRALPASVGPSAGRLGQALLLSPLPLPPPTVRIRGVGLCGTAALRGAWAQRGAGVGSEAEEGPWVQVRLQNLHSSGETLTPSLPTHRGPWPPTLRVNTAGSHLQKWEKTPRKHGALHGGAALQILALGAQLGSQLPSLHLKRTCWRHPHAPRKTVGAHPLPSRAPKMNGPRPTTCMRGVTAPA